MALDYIIGGLQLLSAAVNVLALGAFWISPGLRATANRFVINLLVANVIACAALTPALWLHGGLKTSFHMDNSVASTVETIYQSSSSSPSSNLQFQMAADGRESQRNSADQVIDDNTVNPLHHQKQHRNQQYSYQRANRYERDVEQQPDTIETVQQSAQQQMQNNEIEKSIESLVIERDEQGNIRKILDKQVVDIQTADGVNDQIEIVEEFDAEPASMVGSERVLNAESIPTIKKKSSMARHHRAYTVLSENALIFDCTRFWGFDFAATIGVLSVVLVVGDTWCAVTDPLRYHSRISYLKSWFLIASVWAVSIAVTIISAFRSKWCDIQLETADNLFTDEENDSSTMTTTATIIGTHETMFVANIYALVFSCVYFFVIVLVPIAVVCIMYYKIYSEARQSGLRMRRNGSSPLLQSSLNLQNTVVEQHRYPSLFDVSAADAITMKIDAHHAYAIEDAKDHGKAIPIATHQYRRYLDIPEVEKQQQSAEEPMGKRRRTISERSLGGLKPKLSQFRRHFSARHLAALEKSACEVPAFLTKNHNLGRMISGEMRQVQSSPNLQKLSSFDLLHKVPFCANNRTSTASINQVNNQQSASNAPRALSYMVSIRHRLSNASSIFKYREESRAARIGIVVVAMLMLSYLPYGLLILLQGRFTFIPNASLCSMLFLLIGNLVSPFVFAYRNRRIRRGVCRLFGVDPKSNSYLQKQRAQLRNGQNNNANAKHVRIHRNLSASNFSLNMLPYKFAAHSMLQIQGEPMLGNQVQSRQGSVLVPIDDVETESTDALSHENSHNDLCDNKAMDANNNRLNNNGNNSVDSSNGISTNDTKMAKEKLSLLQRICSNGSRKASVSGDLATDDEKQCNIEIKDDSI